MEPQLLRLKMVQGTREGETLEFRIGSTVRIGRNVRGNSVTIKEDAGISSKHLVISFGSEKCSVQVLDYAAVNSNCLSPYESLDLHDGDTIKLGNSTSILVQIITGEETSQLRRNPRRCVKESSNAGLVAQNSEVMVLEGRKRGRPGQARVLEKETEVLGLAEEKMEGRRVNLRFTRSKKNDASVVFGNLTVGGRKEKACGVRGGRKNLQEVLTENVRDDDVLDEENVVVKDISNEQDIEREVAANQEKAGAVEDKLRKEPVDLGENYRDTSNGTGVKDSNGSEARVSSSENLGKGKQLPDLETMTLEQWFDTLKVDLPKQITKEIDEMIEGMRRKAMRVKEYMMEQKKSMRAVG